MNKLPFRVVSKHVPIRKCSNRNCEKRTECLHSMSRYDADFQKKVTDVFQNNESTCKEFVKVG